MARRSIIFAIVFVLVLSSSSFAGYDRVLSLGIMGQGGASLSGNLTREQLATIAVRLMGLEHLKDSYNKKGIFKDVGNWALPYVNIAEEYKIMGGVSSDRFNPSGSVTYIQVLTILMRLLGYEDGIDFIKFPEDYYSKALEIGLGDVYIPHDKLVTRDVVANTIEKAFDMKLKGMDLTYFQYKENVLKVAQLVPNIDTPIETTRTISIGNIEFNTSIVGSFSGILGRDVDFSQYNVGVYSKDGKLYKSANPNASGSFNISGFDNSIVAKLGGYSYRVYDFNGKLVLSGNLD